MMKMTTLLFVALVAQPVLAQDFDAETQVAGIYATLNYYNSDLSCEKKDDCTAIPVGARACGGPNGYVVASRLNATYDFVETLASITEDLENKINTEIP